MSFEDNKYSIQTHKTQDEKRNKLWNNLFRSLEDYFPLVLVEMIFRYCLSASFYVFGGAGSQNQYIPEIDRLIMGCNQWEPSIPSLSLPRFGAFAAYVNEVIYLIGGYHNTHLNNCDMFNLKSGQWTSMCSMNKKRYLFSGCVYHEMIYVFGGMTPLDLTATAEVYSPTLNLWISVPPMKTAKYLAASCIFRDKIYVIGGTGEQNVLNLCECYDPMEVNGEWHNVAPMTVERRGLVVCADQDYIYAFAGFSSIGCVETLEYYNPLENEWKVLGSMKYACNTPLLGVWGDLVFLTGGAVTVTKSKTLDICQVFDLKKKQWLPDADPMRIARSEHAGCIVPDF